MKRGFSGLYNDTPEWSNGFLKRVRIAEKDRNIMKKESFVCGDNFLEGEDSSLGNYQQELKKN